MSAYRTIHVSVADPNYNRRPKSDYCCVNCHKPIKKTSPHRLAHFVDGGLHVLHPDDEHLYTHNSGDCGLHPLGNDCARRLGLEWTIPSEGAT